MQTNQHFLKLTNRRKGWWLYLKSSKSSLVSSLFSSEWSKHKCLKSKRNHVHHLLCQSTALQQDFMNMGLPLHLFILPSLTQSSWLISFFNFQCKVRSLLRHKSNRFSLCENSSINLTKWVINELQIDISHVLQNYFPSFGKEGY